MIVVVFFVFGLDFCLFLRPAFDPRLSSDEIELWDDNGGPPTPLLVRYQLEYRIAAKEKLRRRRRANVSRLSRSKKKRP